jgi:hypothetical protein
MSEGEFKKRIAFLLKDILDELRVRKPDHLRGVRTTEQQDYFASGFSYAMSKMPDLLDEARKEFPKPNTACISDIRDWFEKWFGSVEK